MTVIAMSRAEIDRMSVLRDLAEDRIGVSEAATLMRLGRRQVFRLATAFRSLARGRWSRTGAASRATGPTRQPCARRSSGLSASATQTSGRRLRPRSYTSWMASVLVGRRSGNG